MQDVPSWKSPGGGIFVKYDSHWLAGYYIMLQPNDSAFSHEDGGISGLPVERNGLKQRRNAT